MRTSATTSPELLPNCVKAQGYRTDMTFPRRLKKFQPSVPSQFISQGVFLATSQLSAQEISHFGYQRKSLTCGPFVSLHLLHKPFLINRPPSTFLPPIAVPIRHPSFVLPPVKPSLYGK